MRTEIVSVADVENLRLIRDASSISQRDISDTASQRLVTIEHSPFVDNTSGSTASQSYRTAHESQDEEDSEVQQPDERHADHLIVPNLSQNQRIGTNLTRSHSAEGIWTASARYTAFGAKLQAFDLTLMASSGVFPTNLEYLRDSLMESAEGTGLWSTEGSYKEHPKALGRLRIKKELDRLFREQDEPGIGCSPIDFDLFHLLAGIEGPPDSPYEGGVFWLEIRLDDVYPLHPPKVRLLTRIYHPNIDSRGQICLDILSNEWSPQLGIRSMLVSLCSLLNESGLEDPLVPEIAETYCKDYELFCRNARTYTARYASAEAV